MNTSLQSLRKHLSTIGILMVVQYALGMYTNLFVAFPDPDKPGQVDHGQMWGFAWSQPALAAHIVVAFLLLGAAIALVVRARHAKARQLYWPAGLGLAAIFAAWFSGATFVPYQIDWWSYSMSLCFLLAFGSYAWGYIALREV